MNAPIVEDVQPRKKRRKRYARRVVRSRPPVAAVPESVTTGPGVMFVCNTVPALGIGLVTGMYMFQGGTLTITNVQDIAAMRAHPWYRLRIFEAGEPDAEVPPPPGPAARQAQLPPPPSAGLASLIVKREDGTYRCRSCGDSLSPIFASESHVLLHLRTIHKVGSITRGG